MQELEKRWCEAQWEAQYEEQEDEYEDDDKDDANPPNEDVLRSEKDESDTKKNTSVLFIRLRSQLQKEGMMMKNKIEKKEKEKPSVDT